MTKLKRRRSGDDGATNVLRTLGKWRALVALIADVLKAGADSPLVLQYRSPRNRLAIKNFSGSGLAVIASVKAHAKISVGM